MSNICMRLGNSGASEVVTVTVVSISVGMVDFNIRCMTNVTGKYYVTGKLSSWLCLVSACGRSSSSAGSG